MDNKLRVIRIIDGTTVDGPGFRTSIYFAGCAHQCPECHNPQSWDFEAGELMTIDDIIDRIAENDMDVTFSGGDPLYQWRALTVLAKEIKNRLGKNVWCYTGFMFEEVTARPELRPLLDYLDVVVDGPFVAAQRDTSFLFRGSANQRLIDVKASLAANAIRLWESSF